MPNQQEPKCGQCGASGIDKIQVKRARREEDKMVIWVAYCVECGNIHTVRGLVDHFVDSGTGTGL